MRTLLALVASGVVAASFTGVALAKAPPKPNKKTPPGHAYKVGQFCSPGKTGVYKAQHLVCVKGRLQKG